MTPEPEIHHHPHRTGHRLIDLAVPVSALAISLISLIIGIHHGHTMGEMAQENARDTMLVMGMGREGQEALWDKLNSERFRLRFRACYCSVFDECRVSDLATVSPQSVEHCAVSPDTFTYLDSTQRKQ